MSNYKIIVSASCRVVGANWKEEVDLLDYLTEDEAKKAIETIKSGGVVEEIEEDMQTIAIQMSGYEWNYYVSNDNEDQ